MVYAIKGSIIFGTDRGAGTNSTSVGEKSAFSGQKGLTFESVWI